MDLSICLYIYIYIYIKLSARMLEFVSVCVSAYRFISLSAFPSISLLYRLWNLCMVAGGLESNGGQNSLVSSMASFHLYFDAVSVWKCERREPESSATLSRLIQKWTVFRQPVCPHTLLSIYFSDLADILPLAQQVLGVSSKQFNDRLIGKDWWMDEASVHPF